MRRAVLACLLVTIVAGVGGYILRRRLAPPSKPLEVIRIERSLPRSERVDDDPGALALSADGRVLVAAVRGEHGTNLLLQYLDKFDATTIPGTDGASSPFLSADGATIGFVAPDGALESVSTRGDSRTPLLASKQRLAGATFGPQGGILVGQRDGGLLRRVSADVWVALTRPAESERAHSWPHWAAGSDAVVFTIEYASPKPSVIALARLSNPASHVVVGPGSRAWLIDGAHLVVARPDGLWRVDLRDGVATGESRIASDVARSADIPIAAAGGGHLIYMPAAAGVAVITARASQPDTPRYLLSGRRDYSTPRLSPDGKSIAVIEDAGARRFALSIYDAASGVAAASAAMAVSAPPRWTDDSRWVLFPEKSGDVWELSWLARDSREGAGKLLTESVPGNSAAVRLRTPGLDAEWDIVSEDGGAVCVTAAGRGVVTTQPAIGVPLVRDACGNAQYDTLADGSRVVAVYRDPVAAPSRLRFILNFAAELLHP